MSTGKTSNKVARKPRLSAEARHALLDQLYWRGFERNGWKCLGFTYRESALFAKETRPGGQSITVDLSWKHLDLLGVSK